jgi:membrane associated rhomboid family serine protease
MTITMLLIVSIGIVSYFCFSNQKLFNQLLFSPYVIIREKEWFRFVTSAWVHGGYAHLLINLFVLYSFGNSLESIMINWFGALGKLYFLVLFIGAVIIAHVPTYFKEKDSYHYASVGASGGVSGVLFASILIDPLRFLYLFGVIPIPGIVFAVLYLWYSMRMSKQANDNINHEAHLFGALGGMILLIIMKPEVIALFGQQLMELVNSI